MFTGANGAGKTNLLEAASLLVPGRGLRGARTAELARRGSDAAGGWAVAASLNRAGATLEIGTATTPESPERRVFLLNGETPRTQAEVAARLSAVWLTPQMDRLFTDPASGRRKFLDRLAIGLEPTHARAIAAFEAASAQRNRLLPDKPDPAWLTALEDAMASHAVAATASRLALIGQLNAVQRTGAADPFPRVELGLDCPIAAKLDQAPALEVEDFLRAAYAAGRTTDLHSRGPAIGPTRTDLTITDAESRQPASLASTGQQKAMLLGIVLAHAAMITMARRAPPLLLLDEPLVHLDETRRSALFAALSNAGTTAWLTGTDLAPFAPLRSAACYRVADGHITGP